MSVARAFGGTEKTDVLLDSQKWLIDKMAGLVNNQLGQGVQAYGGQITPDLNPLLQAGFDSASGILGRPNSNLNAAVSSLLSGAGDPEGVRSAYEAQLAPARFAFQDSLREMRNRYGDTFGKSGALPYAEAIANSRFGADQSALLANLAYNDRQQAMNRQLGGVSAAIGVNNMGAQNLNQLLNVGDLQRTYQGQQNAESYQKWFDSQAYNNPWLQLAGMALGAQPKGQQQVGGIVPGTIGALGDIASIASAGG